MFVVCRLTLTEATMAITLSQGGPTIYRSSARSHTVLVGHDPRRRTYRTRSEWLGMARR